MVTADTTTLSPSRAPGAGAASSVRGPLVAFVAALGLFLAGCAPGALHGNVGLQNAATNPNTDAMLAARAARGPERGMASWYGPGFAGRLTANGEVFDPSQMTAAHKELPFNTLVRVTNLDNGRSTVVRINDRGPFKPGRIIDLSRAGAEAIGMVGSGVARVTVEVLTLPEGVVRVGASEELRGFEVMSRFHPVGTLMVLSPMVGDPLVVRVVSQEFPIESPADIMVGFELYAEVGSEARLHVDQTN